MVEHVVRLKFAFLRKTRNIIWEFYFFGGFNVICPYEGMCKLISQMVTKLSCDRETSRP